VAIFVASAGYVGFAPIAPGTWGAALGLALHVALRWSGSGWLELLVIAVVFAAGLWSAGRVEHELGKDPAAVVVDEVLGMLITLALLDVSVAGAVTGFVIFRVLDVIKPFPAARFEHIKGGMGVMLDDVMAGVYSNLALRLLSLAIPGLFA
jgi:phosphatidylglycerophosphatase A